MDAHALAAHGRPRATQDIDFWVDSSIDNATRLCAALAEFGFPALGKAIEEFSTPDRMATLGHPPLRIDVMTSIDGVTFDEAWDGRLRGHLGPHEVGYLGRREFVMNKRASGRPKDLADIALLAEIDE